MIRSDELENAIVNKSSAIASAFDNERAAGSGTQPDHAAAPSAAASVLILAVWAIWQT